MKKLQQKTAIITGGSSGIGLATARLFLEEGANVVVTSRKANRIYAELNDSAFDGHLLAIDADVTAASQCQHVVDKTVETFGRIDVLFNNAGVIYVDKSVVDTTEEMWRETIDVNLTGTFLMSRYAVPEIERVGGGAIVNMSSVFGVVGGSGVAAYCAAKGGVLMLTKAMAIDHAPENIRVNCICPGSVDTPMLKGEMEDLGGVDEMRTKFAARHPLNRICSPEEIAQTVLFLACDDSSFITGVALPVDGGRSAC